MKRRVGDSDLMLFLSHDAGGRGGRRGWGRTEEAEKEGRELRTREKGEV